MHSSRRTFLQSTVGAVGLALMGGRGEAKGGGSGSGARKGMRILILGGTGFLGPALVEVARAKGHTLTLFNRGKTHPGLFPDIEQLHGDRDGKLDALKDRKWDAVIDTSGYVPRIVRDSALLLQKAVSRYLFISTISVYPDGKKPLTEDSPTGQLKTPTEQVTPESYGPLKALCEQATRDAFGPRATIIRPGLIVGPGDPTDRFTYWPVRLARGGEILAPGDGKDPVQWIDVRDLAQWTIGLIERDVGGTFNALGPSGGLAMSAFLEGVAKGADVKPALTWIASDFLAQHKVEAWSDMPVWVPSESEDKYLSRIDVAKSMALGLHFRPVADTARDTLAWWKAQPAERQGKLRAGLDAEREKSVLAAWHRKT
jgi:2'-hydroxyisoflavone reductase